MKSNVTSLSVCLSAYINLLCNFHILSFAFDLSSSLPVTVFRRPHFLCSIFECGKYKTWYTISTTLSPHSLKFLSCFCLESPEALLGTKRVPKRNWLWRWIQIYLDCHSCRSFVLSLPILTPLPGYTTNHSCSVLSNSK